MIILKPITTAQTIKFIGRVDACDSIVLINEETNTSVTITQTFTLDNYYLSSDIIFDLQEGLMYNLIAYNGVNEIYRDKVYCTVQDVINTVYSINSGEYNQRTSNNEYITL